jgi:hypothetical protein
LEVHVAQITSELSRATFDMNNEIRSGNNFVIFAKIDLYLKRNVYIQNGLFKTLGGHEVSQSTPLAITVFGITIITTSSLCLSLIIADMERNLSFEY